MWCDRALYGLQCFPWSIESYTVKLGYNELGYNELPVITNRFFQFFQSQIQAYYIIQPGYNESRL